MSDSVHVHKLMHQLNEVCRLAILKQECTPKEVAIVLGAMIANSMESESARHTLYDYIEDTAKVLHLPMIVSDEIHP